MVKQKKCQDFPKEEELDFCQNSLEISPKLVMLPSISGDITENDTRYRVKCKIPPDTWKHIEGKHWESPDPSHPKPSGSSYFFSTISRQTLDKMIKQTASSPHEYKADDKPRDGRGSGKMIYKFCQYDRTIGVHGAKKIPCRWIVIAAKANGWIKTAYPVPSPFLTSAAGGHFVDLQEKHRNALESRTKLVFKG